MDVNHRILIAVAWADLTLCRAARVLALLLIAAAGLLLIATIRRFRR